MHITHLPSLRAHGPAWEGECSHCDAREFETEFGTGPVYWWGGVGSALRFADPADGRRLRHPVRCVGCGAEHTPLIELPPLGDDPIPARPQA